ncbi:MAG: glycosyltransferase family 2 protein [Nitrospiraceae bacterium]|nr:glycosyltransferase family 2 protein [Nitrospiraceae bacterium]
MSGHDPLVSVVIPVFNGAPFIEKAVASVRGQRIRNVEMIVVDDGSTDGTQAILASLQREGLRWYQQAHGGPARSRNRGIEAAHGEYIALLDCDDVWLTDKLDVQLSVMQARPEVGVVHTDYEVVDDSGKVLERVHAGRSDEPLVKAFAGGHAALPSTLLIRRHVLRNVGALNADLYGSEDSDLTIRLYEVTQFAWIDRVMVRKLQRGHGYRDMAFDEATHREKVLSSRERFLNGLEMRRPLRRDQRAALDREWASYFLLRGRFAERFRTRTEARRFYRQAIRKDPFRLRGYTRWLRTLM